MHTLDARTYVNANSTKVVDEDSPQAAWLLGNAGDEISDETAARLGLVGAPAKTKGKTKAKQQDAPEATAEVSDELAADDE